MARKTNEDKRIEAAVDAAFYKHGDGRQFSIMDLGKIRKAGIDAAQAGHDIDAAVAVACDKYEVGGLRSA